MAAGVSTTLRILIATGDTYVGRMLAEQVRERPPPLMAAKARWARMVPAEVDPLALEDIAVRPRLPAIPASRWPPAPATTRSACR